MQVLEAPPKIDEPAIPGDDGNARFVMICPHDVKPGHLSEIDPEMVTLGVESDYVGCNSAESLRRVWARSGGTLLGLQISHIACDCGGGCTGSIWGFVIPKRDRELMFLINYVMLAGALSLEQTDDLSIQAGVFTMEGRDGQSS